VGISGIRLKSDGVPAELSELAFASDNTAGSPGVASSGAAYLVVWGLDYFTNIPNLYARRVAALPQEGGLLDASAILVSRAVNAQRTPVVAFDGTNCLLAWTDTRSDENGDIYAALVDGSGKIVASAATGLLLPNLPMSPERKPSVAYDGTNYLIVWEAWGATAAWDLYGVRMGRDGTLLDKTPIVIATSTDFDWYADIAFDGANYLVVYRHWVARSDATTIMGVLIARDGQVGARTSILASPWGPEKARVAWGGSSYLVTYSGQDSTIRGAFVSPSGTVTKVDQLLAAADATRGYAWGPDIASSGSGFLVAYERTRSSMRDIEGVLVNASGTVSAPATLLTKDCQGCLEPRVTWDGSNYVVAWVDSLNRRSGKLHAAWIAKDGAIVGGSPLA
jgi:hypothetical protein